MNTLQVSDLFQKSGFKFDWDTRIADQKRLIERLNQFEVLRRFAVDLDAFCQDGVASMPYLEYVLEKVNVVCKANNIEVA